MYKGNDTKISQNISLITSNDSMIQVLKHSLPFFFTNIFDINEWMMDLVKKNIRHMSIPMRWPLILQMS